MHEHRRLRAGLAVVGGTGLAIHFLHATTGAFGDGADQIVGTALYNSLTALAGLACVIRAVLVPRERLAWWLIGLGMTASASADLVYSAVYHEDAPVPSLADALWLAFYPAAYGGLALIVRSRLAHAPRSLWLDGVIGALGIGAVAAAVVLPPILAAPGANLVETVVNLAYPVGDILMVMLLTAVFAASGWRPGRDIVVIAVGLGVMAAVDAVFMVQYALDTYVAGGPLDTLWPLASLLIAAGAWQRPAAERAFRLTGWRPFVGPAFFGMLGLGLLVLDHFQRVTNAALVLAALTLVGVIVRLAATFRENLVLVARLEHDALTDALTGLGNRRRLLRDVDAALARGDRARLMLIDLDGFKGYNDAFGHPAGDALLTRFARKLEAAVGRHGRAYRMGGDEFCALLRDDALDGATLTAALSERGEGFAIGASAGEVELPGEAGTTSQALATADRRMYARKDSRRAGPRRQTRDVLMAVLRERSVLDDDRGQAVARLALATGRRLGLDSEALDELARAAELHDIGKVAIPDEILKAPRPLDPDEWRFLRQHPVLGERILSAAPALRPVARLVRSSHERWDGNGYPDHLSGEAIPLGSRIIAACDALQAMTSDRPYRTVRTHREALRELRRWSGSQFDPDVVGALCAAVEAGEHLAEADAPVAPA